MSRATTTVVAGFLGVLIIAACTDGGGSGGTDAVQEVEPNDDIASATFIGDSGMWSFAGTCEEDDTGRIDDFDFFRIDAQAGTLYATLETAPADLSEVGEVIFCIDDAPGGPAAETCGYDISEYDMTMNLAAPISVFLQVECISDFTSSTAAAVSYAGTVEVP